MGHAARRFLDEYQLRLRVPLRRPPRHQRRHAHPDGQRGVRSVPPDTRPAVGSRPARPIAEPAGGRRLRARGDGFIFSRHQPCANRHRARRRDAPPAADRFDGRAIAGHASRSGRRATGLAGGTFFARGPNQLGRRVAQSRFGFDCPPAMAVPLAGSVSEPAVDGGAVGGGEVKRSAAGTLAAVLRPERRLAAHELSICAEAARELFS